MKELFWTIMLILSLPVILLLALICTVADKITGRTDDNYGEDVWQPYF